MLQKVQNVALRQIFVRKIRSFEETDLKKYVQNVERMTKSLFVGSLNIYCYKVIVYRRTVFIFEFIKLQ